MKVGILRKVKHQTWVANPVMNAGAIHQRLVEKVFHDQIGRNLEAYVDNMAIKSTSEEEMLTDIKETFEKFRSINMKLNPKKCSFGVKEGPFLGHLITKQGIRANPSKVKAITNVGQLKMLKDVHSLNGKIAALSRFLSKGVERSFPFFKVLKSCIDKKNIQWTQEAEASLQEMKKFMEILPMLMAPVQEEILIIYLTASTESIRMEKLILALVHAARRLRRKSDEMPKDYLIEVPLEDNKKETKEKADTKPAKTSCEWKLFTDRAVSSDSSGTGLMLIDPEGKEYTYALRFRFKTTNNKVEYEALLARLRISQEMEITSLAIFVDSQLLVNQIKVLSKRSIEDKEILQVETKEGESWMTPIHVYLNHEAMVLLALNAPRHYKDTSRLQKIQGAIRDKESSRKQRDDSRKWMAIQSLGVNILGPLPTAPGGFKFLATAVEHSTKWVEAKPLTVINRMHAERFVWEYAVCRFGVPRTISSKDEKHFREGIFVDLCKGLKVMQSFFPITEHTEIMNHIEKQLAQSQEGWVDDLAQVIWIHRMLPRNSQKETPFSLTYGSEAIIPISETNVT
ncbi:reverse transcriptase domain-containing protein [Tanacetum coccineum]